MKYRMKYSVAKGIAVKHRENAPRFTHHTIIES